MMKDNVLLKVDNLTLESKDHTTLLKDISFEVKKGEILSIVGLSGCGKSLTCKAILGLNNKRQFKSSGEIIFKNMPLHHIKKKELLQVRGKDICMIMQNPLTAFNPLMTIGDQLVETIKYHKKIKKNECLKIIEKSLLELHLTDIPLILHSHPHTLSGGMLQRIMIGLALSLKPSLIIADEITSSIDAATKKSVLNELLRIKKMGIAILFVSHDIHEIGYISDRIIVMKDGKIVEEGPVESIMKNQKNPHTRTLLNARLIN